MSVTSTALVLLAIVCLLIMVILLNVATRSAHQVRSSIFPIVREEGTARMRRAWVGAVVAALVAALAAVAFFLTSQVSLPRIVFPSPIADLVIQASPTTPTETTAIAAMTPTALSVTPTAAASPTPASETQTPTASAAPVTLSPRIPTLTATATATSAATLPQQATAAAPAATFTPTPIPTRTPTSTAIVTVGTATLAPTAGVTATIQVSTPTATPKGSPVPAPAGVEIGPIEFSLEIDDRRAAVNPSTVFSDTTRRVYAVFPFSGMEKGLSWTQVWYFNGSEIIRDQAEWQWGIEDRSYVFVNLIGAGEYRLELYVNDELQASGKFTVRRATAISGTRTP
jgi:hypothetical protein